jgi:acetyltransferase-like isoleucine patch superfamily enzyme
MPVAIDKALTEAGIDLSELDGIAFTLDASERLVDGMLFQDDVGEDFALGGDDCGAGVICTRSICPSRLIKRSPKQASI